MWSANHRGNEHRLTQADNMPADYNSTARALSLPISPSTSPTINHHPIRTAWPRSQSSMSRGRSRSPYSSKYRCFRDKMIDIVDRFQRRTVQTITKLSLVQRIAAALLLMTALTLTVLFFVYNHAILEWLQPIALKWKNLNGGWLILWAMTFATAFPPMIGYSTCVTISGFVYGFPIGFVYRFPSKFSGP